MPKFFQPIYTNTPQVVMPIFGIKCKVVLLSLDCDEYNGMPLAATLSIERTEEPLTESVTFNGLSGNKQVDIRSMYKWGGYPEFIQNHVCPMSEDGRMYAYICTIRNDWGDCGNANIFALIGFDPWVKSYSPALIVQDVFVEASCH